MKRAVIGRCVAGVLLVLGVTSIAACASSPPPDEVPTRPETTTADAPATSETSTASAPATATATASAVPTAEASAAPTATAAATAVATAATLGSASAAATFGPPGANLNVGSMTVDGLSIENLACRADGLGVLGSMVVVGAISKKKAALNACAPKGERVTVEWTAAKGVIGKAKAKASTPAIEACVVKALNGTVAPFEGECAATLALGK